jgi:hypothetical protein
MYRIYNNIILLFISCWLFSFFLTCSNGGHENQVSQGAEAETVHGQLFDGPVQGVGYESFSYSGITAANGSFYCNPGENVQFKIGNIEIGEVNCQEFITPLELAEKDSINDNAVINIARFLQSLDSDQDEDLIRIDKKVREKAENNSLVGIHLPLDFNDNESFEQQALLLLQKILEKTDAALVSPENARKHYLSSLGKNNKKTPGYLQAKFSWEPVNNAQGYNLYYAREPNVKKDNYSSLDGGTRVVNVSKDYIKYIPRDDMIYYFVLTAVDAENSESEESEEVSLLVRR